VVFGGIHPTVEPVKVMENSDIDFVIRGEGEETLLELVEAILYGKSDSAEIDGLVFREDGTIKVNRARRLISDLDKLPFTARGLNLYPELYTPGEMGHLITSRGCPFECTFCEAHQMWTRRVRFRKPENVVEEIKYLINEYHCRDIRFQDDSFTVNRKNIIELCQRIISEGLHIDWTCLSRVDLIDDELLSLMKRAGCTKISFGIESGSQRIREGIKKGIDDHEIYKTLKLVRKNHIRFSCCFMVGLPSETKKDVEKSIAMIRKIKPDFTNVCTFTPYPGSPIYEDCLKRNLIEDKIDWGRYSHHSPFNRFFADIHEKDFLYLLTKMAKTADYYNAGINLSFLMSRFKAGWRSYLANPSRILQNIHALSALALCSLKGRIKLAGSRSFYYLGKDNCGICGKGELKVIWKEDSYRIGRCRNCGSISQSRQLNERGSLDICDQSYFINNYLCYETERIGYFQEKWRKIENLVGRKGQLLDIGCGVGFFLKVASENGWKTWGIEPSIFASQYGRDRFGLNIFTGRFDEASFPQGSFDVITMWDVIPLIPAPALYLKKVYSLLKRDGFLLIKISCWHANSFRLASLINRFFKTQDFLHIKYQLNYFNPATLRNLLIEAGYRIVWAEAAREIKKRKRRPRSFKERGRSILLFIIKLLNGQESFICLAQKRRDHAEC
jgi:radical SAM superfamily enzyme YgiQ (UPF0313 family)/SAM-dependent methyltransferase